jgi:hypothetical protein
MFFRTERPYSLDECSLQFTVGSFVFMQHQNEPLVDDTQIRVGTVLKGGFSGNSLFTKALRFKPGGRRFQTR